MREFKFRVYDERLKDYAPINCVAGFISECGDTILELRSGEFIIEQYTGLNDKNGEEIYEGDILSYKRSSRVLRDLVIFSDGAFWCGFHNGSSTTKRIKLIQSKRVEITGNIHET